MLLCEQVTRDSNPSANSDWIGLQLGQRLYISNNSQRFDAAGPGLLSHFNKAAILG